MLASAITMLLLPNPVNVTVSAATLLAPPPVSVANSMLPRPSLLSTWPAMPRSPDGYCSPPSLTVPVTLMPSTICTAVLSSELIVVVTNVLAFNVPDMLTPSLICIAVESPDEISFTSKMFALSVPDMFTASLICIAVESPDEISFTSMLSTLNSPDMFTASSICMAEESALDMVLVTMLGAVMLVVADSVPCMIICPEPDAESTRLSLVLVVVMLLSDMDMPSVCSSFTVSVGMVNEVVHDRTPAVVLTNTDPACAGTPRSGSVSDNCMKLYLSADTAVGEIFLTLPLFILLLLILFLYYSITRSRFPICSMLT